MGPAALTKKGHRVEPGFTVGDRVLFHWEHAEKMWTVPWLDGDPIAYVPQSCVDAVYVDG
jgi:hypothetical protein